MKANKRILKRSGKQRTPNIFLKIKSPMVQRASPRYLKIENFAPPATQRVVATLWFIILCVSATCTTLLIRIVQSQRPLELLYKVGPRWG